MRARELLRDAGWFIVDGVLSNAAGEIFEMEFLTRSPSEARTLLPYFQRLEQLGIRARMAPASGDSEWINRLRQFRYDAALVSMRIQMPPVIGLVDRFHSDTATVPTSANRSGISNPVVDFLIEKAVSAASLPQMIAACRALDRVLLWQYYQIPLYAVDTANDGALGEIRQTGLRAQVPARLSRRLVVRRRQGRTESWAYAEIEVMPMAAATHNHVLAFDASGERHCRPTSTRSAARVCRWREWRSAGLPVPPGFTVATSAYRKFVTDSGLQQALLEHARRKSSARLHPSRQRRNAFRRCSPGLRQAMN